MQIDTELAIEAVQYRREGSPLFSAIIEEMEARLSPNRIRRLLEQAEASLTNSQPNIGADPHIDTVHRVRTPMFMGDIRS